MLEFVEKVGFEPHEWKKIDEAVMNAESGAEDKDDLISKWGGKSRQDWWG